MAQSLPEPGPRAYVRLFALSFLTLFLELMLIRWVPGVVRLVAYYTNLLLISSFLGLGIGAMLGTRRRRLLMFFPLLLALDVFVLVLMRGAKLPTTLFEFRFFQNLGQGSGLVLIAIFLANTALFVPLGQEIGGLFSRLPTLRAYAWDLAGSLCGTVGFGLFSYLHFSPIAGAAGASVLFLLLLGRWGRVLQALPGLGAALVLMASVTDPNARWSPYYHITVSNMADGTHTAPPVAKLRTMRDPPAYVVRVNQDFYQYHFTGDVRRFTPGTAAYRFARFWEVVAGIPYRFRPHPGDVLVVGAGGGSDVEAALLAGARHVDAVEIDPVLIAIARRYSAAGVYDNPRVSLNVNDARTQFRRSDRTYDVVVFGFLDSQGLSSAMSNIRLDSYVYTVESVRAAFAHVRPGGVLALSFATVRPWVGAKLANMILAGTGRVPILYLYGTNATFVVPRDRLAALPGTGLRPEVLSSAPITPPTDDWPYLYLSFPTIPSDYLIVIGTLLAISAIAVGVLLPRTGQGGTGFEFLFLGAGFLLLQTRSVVDCALYFGATWLVTTIVVAGVLLMIMAANVVAMRIRRFHPAMYVPLLASLILLYLVPRDLVLAAPTLGRFAWALLAVPIPIFFAGLIFSTRFRAAPDTTWALGINLVGAVLGGFLEYTGMAIGGRALLIVAAMAYLASFVAARVSDRARASLAAPPATPALKPQLPLEVSVD